MESQLQQRVTEVLAADDSLVAAASEYLVTISPAIEAICSSVPVDGFSRDLVFRCIARRTQESLAATLFLARSEHAPLSPVLLRPLCEDLIFAKWLRTLDQQLAETFVTLSALNEGLQSLEVQLNFLPDAYEELAPEINSGVGAAHKSRRGLEEDLGRDSSEVRAQRQQCLADLRTLGATAGWKKGRAPTVRAMARIAEATDAYDFFYHGTSKAVHSNLHQMARMVWGEPGGRFDIASSHMGPYYKTFVIAYGVWLADHLLAEVVELEFTEECALIESDARSVWLAFVLVGLARNGALPPLVTKEELAWSEPGDEVRRNR